MKRGRRPLDRDIYDLAAMGERMRIVRSRLHKTQAEMAAALGVSLSHYSKLEVGIGGMSHGLIYTFCRSFNVNEDWFVSGTGDEPKDFVDPTENMKKGQQTMMSYNIDGDLEKICEFVLTEEANKLADNIATATAIPKARAMAMLAKQILLQPKK